MKDKFFFDTNVLVYMQDASDSVKQQKARSLLSTHLDNGTAVISTQCLQEFYNVLANKMKQDKIKTKQIIHSLSENIPVVQVTPTLIENGIDISINTQFSLWDSLMISAASFAKCTVLYSEDMNDGQVVNGVKILNPFVN